MEQPKPPATSAKAYGIVVETPLGFDDAELKVREMLKQEGFGVLTEIDVKSTLKEKLQVEFRKYKILGACNPPLAHKALTIEPGVGLLLPCNVVIEEGDDGTRVLFLDPVPALAIVGNAELEPVAAEASARLHRVARAMVS
jgi:uncharacterized protein (DUF302 family)